MAQRSLAARARRVSIYCSLGLVLVLWLAAWSTSAQDHSQDRNQDRNQDLGRAHDQAAAEQVFAEGLRSW